MHNLINADKIWVLTKTFLKAIISRDQLTVSDRMLMRRFLKIDAFQFPVYHDVVGIYDIKLSNAFRNSQLSYVDFVSSRVYKIIIIPDIEINNMESSQNMNYYCKMT